MRLARHFSKSESAVESNRALPGKNPPRALTTIEIHNSGVFDWRNDLQNLWHAEMAGGRIGSLVEGLLLAQTRTRRIVARGFGALSFGRQSARRRFHLARVEFVQLFDVGNDVRNLRREGLAFFRRDLEMRQQRDFFDVSFGDWHFSFQLSVVSRQLKPKAHG